MNKLILIVLPQFALLYSQPPSSPLHLHVGLKAGMNHSVWDPDEGIREISGKEFHFGIGVGFDMQPCLAVNITPQIKFSSRIQGFWPGTDYHFTNLFTPVVVSLRLLPTHPTSPYLSIGGAANFQLNGKAIYTEWGTGSSIEDLRNDFYFVAALGIESKLARLKIAPEFSFNYNLTAKVRDTIDIPVTVYDLHLALGLYYALLPLKSK